MEETGIESLTMEEMLRVKMKEGYNLGFFLRKEREQFYLPCSRSFLGERRRLEQKYVGCCYTVCDTRDGSCNAATCNSSAW